MSETRALRDKLEETQGELRRTRQHLEKLRAHQSREQDSLRQELEAARREVEELRARLRAMEDQEQEPRLEAGPALLDAEAVLASQPASVRTALVALARKPASVEDAILTLTRVLRVPPIDLRLRLMGMPPVVVARLPLAEAAALREVLRAEGFVPVSSEVLPRAAGGMMTVRRFTLEEQGMSLNGTKGERQQVLYSELRLLVRGRRSSGELEARTGRDVPPELDDGIEHFKAEMRRSNHEQFLRVYGEGVRVAFTQETVFTGPGGLLGLSRFDSLQRLTEELRKRAPRAVFDERLMRTPRLILPLVEEERSQELFANLLDQAVQEGLWP